MRFAAAWVLPLLPLVVVLLPLLWLLLDRGRERRLERIASRSMLEHIAPQQRPFRRWTRRSVLLLAVVCLGLAAARPQWGEREDVVRRLGVDVMFVLDTSLSMTAGEGDRRLDEAKRVVIDLVRELRGDRVGLVAFAGDAQVLCPLTVDYAALRLLLDAAEPDLLPTPGSDLGHAIRKAISAFEREDRKFKVIVLLTDGEDHGGTAALAARAAVKQGAVLHAIGFGEACGEPIPLLDAEGRIIGHKKDSAGKIVTSRLDEVSLTGLADIGDGVYVPGRVGDRALTAIVDAVAGMEKREIESKVEGQRRDRFAWPLLGAMLLLSLEVLLGIGGDGATASVLRPLSERRGVRKTGAAGVIVVGLMLVPDATADAVDDGLQAFQEQRFDDAVRAFERAVAEQPASAVLRYNLGTALLRAGRHDDAIRELRAAVAAGGDEVKARAAYNLGNALYAAGSPGEALAQYRAALRLAPPDAEAKHNYERVLGELEQNPDPSPSPSPSPTPSPSPSRTPSPAGPSPTPTTNPSATPPAGAPPPQQMSREQAERWLDAIEEQERREARGRKRKAHSTVRRPSKDW